MYTDMMRRAFHQVQAPPNFSVELLDNDNFLTIRLDEKKFYGMTDEQKREALQYVVTLKKALEENGAVVLVVRKAIDG
jgi:hypothetical protein